MGKKASLNTIFMQKTQKLNIIKQIQDSTYYTH